MPWSGNGLGHFNFTKMINWTKDSWEDVKMVLDELEYDYVCDFEGNLILHFENFEIVDENTKKVVDTVDQIWLKFEFTKSGYVLRWYRNDIYNSNTNYVHPHVNGSDHCTGDYVRGVSLCRDLLYYSNYIKRYNSGQGWTTIPSDSNKLSVDTDSLNKQLIPTFYMDMTQGCPALKDVEFEGDLNSVVKQAELKNPKTFFWKNNQYTQYSKGSRIEHLDLKKYFNYAQYFKRYSDAASTVSNANAVSKVQ